VFNVSFDEIARVIDRTPDAARQLASRARRRVQGAAPSPDTDRVAQRRIVEAFLAAARAGDFDALVEMLAPDVVMRTDGGGSGPLARPPLVGVEAVARQFKAQGPRYAHLGRPVVVNGAVGVLVGPTHDPIAVVNFTIARGLVTAIDFIGDPEKLRHIFVD
jgi:RNA polymerase sigma-70 factor (ECF subfamily)